MLIRLFYRLVCGGVLYDLLRLSGLGWCVRGVFVGVFGEGLLGLGLGVLVCGGGSVRLLVGSFVLNYFFWLLLFLFLNFIGVVGDTFYALSIQASYIPFYPYIYISLPPQKKI